MAVIDTDIGVCVYTCIYMAVVSSTLREKVMSGTIEFSR